MPNKTIQQIAAELRKRDRHDPMAVMRVSELSEIADALEGVAKRAYNEIDKAVCGIDEASHFDIDDVRRAMDNTIGEYYE